MYCLLFFRHKPIVVLLPLYGMEKIRPRLYFFNWPSHVGGADTKLVHLLLLLHKHCLITVIPNDGSRLREREWTKVLDRLGVRATLLEHLPRQLEGFAIFCPTGASFLIASHIALRNAA
ncbi:MAG: hypothetical protein WKF37_02620 [Bryobacteraceae bacterium]